MHAESEHPENKKTGVLKFDEIFEFSDVQLNLR